MSTLGTSNGPTDHCRRAETNLNHHLAGGVQKMNANIQTVPVNMRYKPSVRGLIDAPTPMSTVSGTTQEAILDHPTPSIRQTSAPKDPG